MLQIRLSKPASEAGASAKNAPVDTVTVSCPDHLVLANLPVAKGLGSPSSASVIKSVGRKSRRQLGERVHFCVRCDFPIAIYGRLIPCEHAFCLDCARSDSLCYLCDDRIQKIQTIKMMEGMLICAAPHCLKSFLKKADFESHIHETHADLIDPTRRKESEVEDKTPRLQNRYPSPAVQHSSDGNNQFPRSASQNRFPDSVTPSSALAPPQFGYPPYTPEQFFGTPKSDSTPESGAGFRAAGQMNFPLNYPKAWNMAPGTVPLEPPMVVATQPLPLPHLTGDRLFSGDGNQDTPPGFGWLPEKREN